MPSTSLACAGSGRARGEDHTRSGGFDAALILHPVSTSHRTRVHVLTLPGRFLNHGTRPAFEDWPPTPPEPAHLMPGRAYVRRFTNWHGRLLDITVHVGDDQKVLLQATR